MMEPMQPTPDTNRRIRQRSWGVMAAHYGKLIGAQLAYAGLVYAAVLLFALPAVPLSFRTFGTDAPAGSGYWSCMLAASLFAQIVSHLLILGHTKLRLTAWCGGQPRVSMLFDAFRGGRRFSQCLLLALLFAAAGLLCTLPGMLLQSAWFERFAAFWESAPSTEAVQKMLAATLSGALLPGLQLILYAGYVIFLLYAAPAAYLLITGVCATAGQSLREAFRRMQGQAGRLFCFGLSVYWPMIAIACVGFVWQFFSFLVLFAALAINILSAAFDWLRIIFILLLLFFQLLSFLGTLFAIAPRFPLALAGYMARLLPDCAAAVQPSVEGDCACR